MARHYDERADDVGLNLEMRLWRLAGQVKEIAEEMERDLGRRIRDGRPWTASSVTGMPCVAEIAWDGEDSPEIATHAMEPLDNASLKDEPPSRPLP